MSIKPFNKWLNENNENETSELNEMNSEYYDLSGVSSKATGLPYSVFFAVGVSPKNPKIYLKNDGKYVGISLRDGSDDEFLQKFIDNNRDLIVKYWNYKISTKKLIDGFVKV